MKKTIYIALAAIAMTAASCSENAETSLPTKAMRDSLKEAAAPAEEVEAAPAPEENLDQITGEVIDGSKRSIVIKVDDNDTREIELPEAFEGSWGEIGDTVTVRMSGDSVISID